MAISASIGIILLCFLSRASFMTFAMSAVRSSLRTRLLSSRAEKSYGPLLLSASPTIAEILAGIGYSHIVVDMEHSPLDIGSTLDMLRAIDSLSHPSTTTIVRMPCHNDVALTKKILDIMRKPAGILFPLVETAADAKLAVSSTRYPEYGGIRGCAHPVVRASGYGTDENYYYQTSRDLFVMVQAESETAIENIPEIAAVDGVDGIFVGPFDLSCSMRKMGQFEEDGDVMKRLRQAEESIVTEGLVLAGYRSTGRSLEDMFSAGYQLVCGSLDVGLLQGAAMDDLQEAQKAMDATK